ncbi:hypothetical protein [Polaromonas sp.]|uniref:hypothetical protein n=1 Tax=Polaromonas sp. TaxID=1869339 RepID=UPI0017CA4833|nr:hypothetical protein [Polaromonas sp.]NML87265.1 hypothetical protein [Polaromonas sp.]
MALAPKVEAINNSRTRPVIRDSNVKRETVEADLKSDTTGVYALALSLCQSLRANGGLMARRAWTPIYFRPLWQKNFLPRHLQK